MEKMAVKVVYLLIKEKGIEDCFGSITAIYDYYTSEDIGYSLRALQRLKISSDKTFETEKVKIKIFHLKTKKREH